MSLWAFYAVISSLFIGLYFFLNQYVKLAPRVFIIYRGLGTVLFVLPFMFLFEPINDWRYYVVCILQGFSIAFIDYKYFQAINKWGAEVVTSLQPLNIGITFLLWIMVKPSMIMVYWANPWHFIFIILCLGGIVWSIFSFNKVVISKQALKFLAVCLFVGAVCEIFNKLAMVYGGNNAASASYYYILITGFVIGVINLFLYIRQKQDLKVLIEWKNLKYNWMFGILILSMVARNFAVLDADNPAYVSAMIYVYVLWIILLNKFLKRCNIVCSHGKTDLKTVIFLLVSAVGLILLTN